MQIKTLIIEDETAAAVNLHALLSEVEPSIEVIGVLESVAESVDYLRSNPSPELIFMIFIWPMAIHSRFSSTSTSIARSYSPQHTTNMHSKHSKSIVSITCSNPSPRRTCVAHWRSCAVCQLPSASR